MSTSLTVTINSINTTRKHQIEDDKYFKQKTAKVHETELITHSHLVKRLTLHGNQYTNMSNKYKNTITLLYKSKCSKFEEAE